MPCQALLPLVIELAGAPRGKSHGRPAVTAGHARIYQDAKTRSYEAQLRYAAQQVMAGAPLIGGPLRVDVTARVPIPKTMPKRDRAKALAGELWPVTRPDLENYAKAMDALNGVVWIDDKQLVYEFIRKIYSEAPGLHIRVGRP